MANEGEGLGKVPEILAKRQAIVTLADGSTIVVHKWGRDKFSVLLPLVGSLKDFQTIAEQSVAEVDRERVRGMEPDDQLAISVAATALNVTEAVLKNLRALLDQNEGLAGALAKRVPSNLK